MPRIKAASVAEHVAEQEAAVFAAAVRLFTERGYDHVTLADVAAEVGLARNSLYRYFPDKAHILLRWFRQELPAQWANSAELLSGDGTPIERIERWALANLDYARTPEHALIAQLTSILPDLDPAARAELDDSHRRLFAPLDGVLREAGIRKASDRRVVASFIAQLVNDAAEMHAPAGTRVPSQAIRSYLLRAVRGLLAE